MKKCKCCNQEKSIKDFYIKNSYKSYMSFSCKDCRIKKNKLQYRKKIGVMNAIYRGQLRNTKIKGFNEIAYTYSEFKDWILNQDKFNKLYDFWVLSGYKTLLKPSVDRKDDYKGYSLNNIQLMTWGENKRKGHVDRKNGNNNKYNKAILQYDLNDNFIKEHYSIKSAERELNVGRQNISSACHGRFKQAYGYKWKFKESAQTIKESEI